MELSSVRALKDELANDVVQPMLHAFGVRSPLDQAAQPMSTASGVHRAFALGITRRNGADFRLAIRVQRRSVQDGKAVESIIARTKGEVDLRYKDG